eukprot:TRINITY_DN10598_c0_g1_i1.p1 TRINITY_DN10598_c0_g1~~TRINITY_DN10598_c0_g1_i1.p1  ORF type:complete len:340 (-),score=92.61 TRINITY_DN10598_c0_g1_i1:135-1154(-)
MISSNPMDDVSLVPSTMPPGLAHQISSLPPLHSMGLSDTVSMDPSANAFAQISKDSRERIQNTMVGKLAQAMREHGELSLQECYDAVEHCFHELRKPDGTKYKGAKTKVVQGTLYSTGVFQNSKLTNKWSIKEPEMTEYEKRLEEKFERKSRKRRTHKNDEEKPLPFSEPINAPQLMSFTSSLSDLERKESVARAFMRILEVYKRSPDVRDVFENNPFEDLVGDEGVDEFLRNKLGDEQFVLSLQVFDYFQELLMEGMMPTKKNPDTPVTMQVNQLRKQLLELQSRLQQCEQRLPSMGGPIPNPPFMGGPGNLPPLMMDFNNPLAHDGANKDIDSAPPM